MSRPDGSGALRSVAPNTAGTVAATASAISAMTAKWRTRPGTNARKRRVTIGTAKSDPRLWASSARSTSTTAPPAKTARSIQGTARAAASVIAGHRAMSHTADAPFG